MQAELLQPSDDALQAVLRMLVLRDLLDASTHMMEDTAWTPMTTAYARRVRELQERYGIWDSEPELVREVLDGP